MLAGSGSRNGKVAGFCWKAMPACARKCGHMRAFCAIVADRSVVRRLSDQYISSMRTRSHNAMPPNVKRGLRQLGSQLNIARRRRRLTIVEVAEAAATTPDTVRRLEAGAPGVSIGVLAMVLLALGEASRLGELLDSATDDAGLVLSEAQLPQRVRRKRSDKELAVL